MLGAVALFAACAQTGVLTGGGKDTTPPVAIDSAATPPNYTTGFNQTQIVIPFSEYVRLVDARRQIVVSPPLPEDAKFKLRKKDLEVTLPDSLLPNTTYTINFGDAIQDITEGNKASNLKYVFSTGSVIDSLSWTGMVRNAFDLSPLEEVLVMLYADTRDSIPMLERPRYFAKTDKQGRFRIDFIKGGQYRAFALADGNFNYLFDLPNEQIGYQDELITLPSTDSVQSPTTFDLFFEDSEPQYLEKSNYQDPGRLDLVFHRPPKNLSITLMGAEGDDWYQQLDQSANGDSLSYWLDGTRFDTLEIAIADDTLFIDTIVLPLKRRYADSKQTKLRPPVLTARSNARANFDLHRPLEFTFNHPVSTLSRDSIQVLSDSVPVPFDLSAADSTLRRWFMHVQWESEKIYDITLLPGAATDLYGLRNRDSLNTGFVAQRENYYARFKLALELPDHGHPYILQLINGDGKTIREHTLTATGEIDYAFLPPGKFGLKLIYDRDGDGDWSTGHYLDQIPPEKVIYFNQSIDLRSNWEQAFTWKVLEE